MIPTLPPQSDHRPVNITKILFFFNLAIVAVLCISVTANGISKWGHHHAMVQGIVTKITPEEHRYIYSEYTVDGKLYTTVGSADCTAYRLGSPIDVFYRIDRPDVVSYDEVRFSFLDNLQFVLVGTVFCTVFIWALGRKVLIYFNRDNRP
jgi:hypothetical protein